MKYQEKYLYMQLMNDLLLKIKNGLYPEGALLPSENELCKQYNVSRSTVRKALQELVKRGIIVSAQGKGSIVCKLNGVLQKMNSIYSFDKDMKKIGKTPETKVIDFIKMGATDTLAKIFIVPKGTFLYRIMRLRLADGIPMLLETNYLLSDQFEGLTMEDLEGNSLYAIFASKYNVILTRAEESFEPVILQDMEAHLLGAPLNSLGMLVERVSYQETHVVEFSKSVSPNYKFKHYIELK